MFLASFDDGIAIRSKHYGSYRCEPLHQATVSGLVLFDDFGAPVDCAVCAKVWKVLQAAVSRDMFDILEKELFETTWAHLEDRMPPSSLPATPRSDQDLAMDL
jgi:hypothetical protein